MKYEELVKALRDLHRDPRPASAEWLFENQVALYDAAAAIEALMDAEKTYLAELAQCHENLRRAAETRRERDERIEALQAQLPKRGEWIKHPEVKNIYGGECIECPFCGEKYVVQNVSDEKFCRNCGANMRAKMEVQDEGTGSL